MAEEQREQQTEETQEKGKKKKKIILLVLLWLLILLLLIVAGTTYYYLFHHGKTENNTIKEVKVVKNKTIEKPKPPPELKELAQPGIFINLGDFIVNLADPDVQRFAKVSITIEVVNEKVQNEVNQYMPAIKDAIVDLISSKYYKDIKTPEGRERLKIEILKRLNALLPDGGVKAVYFTSFVVQTM